MPSLEPEIESVVTALVEGLRALEVPFCVVGALVPELLLETKPERQTNDADVVVAVPDMDAFAAVKRGLEQKPYEFSPTNSPHRLTRSSGGLADILPYSQLLAPDGVLRLEPGIRMNVVGFDRVIGAAIHVQLESGLDVPVVPLPLFALLKLVAYSDRRARKDLEAVDHVLRHYAGDDDRLWGLEHEGALVEIDFGPAYLLGLDGREFLGPDLAVTLEPLLASFVAPDTSMTIRPLATVAGDGGYKSEWRPSFEELLRWYRRGLEL